MNSKGWLEAARASKEVAASGAKPDLRCKKGVASRYESVIVIVSVHRLNIQ
jgi:hypothetical protein